MSDGHIWTQPSLSTTITLSSSNMLYHIQRGTESKKQITKMEITSLNTTTTWKMNLLLTKASFESISCKPTSYSLEVTDVYIHVVSKSCNTHFVPLTLVIYTFNICNS